MTKNRSYLIIIVIAVLLLGSIFKLGIHSQESKITSYWTEQSEVIVKNRSKEFFDSKIDAGRSISLTFKVGNASNQQDQINVKGCEGITYEINDKINVGIGRFLPFYKNTGVDGEFDIKWSCQLVQNGEKIELTKSGILKLEGRYIHKGMYSTRASKSAIEKDLLNQARRMIAKDIEEEIENYKSNNTKGFNL